MYVWQLLLLGLCSYLSYKAGYKKGVLVRKRLWIQKNNDRLIHVKDFYDTEFGTPWTSDMSDKERKGDV